MPLTGEKWYIREVARDTIVLGSAWGLLKVIVAKNGAITPDADGLFGAWCERSEKATAAGSLISLTEFDSSREQIPKVLPGIVQEHYEDPQRLADDLEELGFEKTSEILRKVLPANKKIRSGELGEILATEFVNRCTDHRVPIRRLRFKDGRDVAMRGDDFIGVCEGANALRFLKGEAKSRVALSPSTVKEARKALDANSGAPNPHTIVFVANRLLESGLPERQALGRRIRTTASDDTIPPSCLQHMIFTFSANPAVDALEADLAAYRGKIGQTAVNLHVPDHQSFVASVYMKALKPKV